MVQDQLEKLRQEICMEIDHIHDLEELRNIKIKVLGKKGELTAILRGMSAVPKEERPHIGGLANKVRKDLEDRLQEKESQLLEREMEEQLEKEDIDVTIPGFTYPMGSSHPLSVLIEEIEDFFIGMGFEVREGPEVETDKYNFEALNLSKDHPARDMQDSFYLTPEILLRTHTSSVQVRTLEKMEGKTPVRIICPGKVYRRDDDDATHSHQFTQIEGLVVDRGVSMSELNGVLLTFIEKMFGEETKVRLRPSYFPFTEPSVEVDIFHQEKEEWMEILGAGMVHPHILSRTGYDPERVSGFAFGMGVERIAMLKYNIPDIRLFYNNDLRFLSQLKSL